MGSIDHCLTHVIGLMKHYFILIKDTIDTENGVLKTIFLYTFFLYLESKNSL